MISCVLAQQRNRNNLKESQINGGGRGVFDGSWGPVRVSPRLHPSLFSACTIRSVSACRPVGVYWSNHRSRLDTLYSHHTVALRSNRKPLFFFFYKQADNRQLIN